MTEIDWLAQRIHWRRSGDVYAPWKAGYDGHALKLRLGDFPAEPLYTLLVDETEALSLDSPWPAEWLRTVELREEQYGQDHRSLWAYIESNGNLAIDGQDLGPSVEQVWGRGIREYEWKRTVSPSEFPRLLAVLGATAGCDVLDALEAWSSTHEPEELEKLIQERNVTSTFWSRCGD